MKDTSSIQSIKGWLVYLHEYMSSIPEWVKLANQWNLPIFHGYSLEDVFNCDFDTFMRQALDDDTRDTSLGATLDKPVNREWKTGGDGFKHKRHQLNGGRRILNTGEYSKEKVEMFQKKYNQYFYALTGKHIDFRITPSSQRYMSMLEACRIRDKVIMTLFEERPIIWDLMGGSGSDSIAFLFDLNPQKLIVVETANGGETADAQRNEFEILEHNMRSFKAAFPTLEQIPHYCFKTECKTFIESPEFARYRDSRVHLVYLDPSWDYDDENPQSKFELTPTSLFKNLERTVWAPMRNANIKVDCYILKTRWSWSKVAQYLEGLSSDYHAVYSIKAQPFRDHVNAADAGEFGDIKGVYHYMVLVHSDHKEIVAHRSKWYMELIRKGKRVYVDKRTTVQPFKPRYTDNLEFPVIYEKPNQFTFTVTPPDVKPGDVEPPPETIPDQLVHHKSSQHPHYSEIVDKHRSEASTVDPRSEPIHTKAPKTVKKRDNPRPKPAHFNTFSVLPEETESKLEAMRSLEKDNRKDRSSFWS